MTTNQPDPAADPKYDYLNDAHPAAAAAARDSIRAATRHGVGSPEHEQAKQRLAEVARQVLADQGDN